MIKVYESDERLFNHNGLKILHPLRADVTKEDNGDYYVELQDSIENIDFYQSGMIVRVPTPWGVQGFRLKNPIVRNKVLEVKGWHLSYDAANYIIRDANAVDKNCNDALEHFNSNTDTLSPFSVISDITTTKSTRAIRKTLLEVYEWLVGSDKYGGHMVRDNWQLGIRQSIGEDRGVVLALGKNITEMQVAEDWDDVCTKILPYTTNKDIAITLDEVYMQISEEIYDIPYSKVVKFSNNIDKDEYESEDAYLQAIKEDLRSQAEAYLLKNKMPRVNYSVSAAIDNVSDVGDVIQVVHPKCKVNILTNVIAIQYDAIREKYIKIEFGNFKNKLKNITQTITDQANKHTDEALEESQTLLRSELEKATAQINGVLGNSYVIYEGDKILVVDSLPKEEAKYVIKITNGGIGFSSSGINGIFSSAWTIDGTLNMQNINVINFTASLIKGGTLKLGGLDNSSGTFELYDETNRLTALMDKEGLTVFATNGDYVKLNAVEGFAGYTRTGAKSYWADGETFHMQNAEIENETKMAGKIKFVPITSGENIGIGIVAIQGGSI